MPPHEMPTSNAAEKNKRQIRWSVALLLPNRVIDLLVTVNPKKSGVSAFLSIPGQGIKNLPLANVSYGPARLGFTLEKPLTPAANEVYTVAHKGDIGRGSMTMGARSFRVRARRLLQGEAMGSALRRPQTPNTPYPYDTAEVKYTNEKDGVVRSGTLSIPKGKGPFPCVIIESGSGAVDRDGTHMRHKAYLVLGDYLTRQGIATLRTDDRGIGGSTGVERDSTYGDLAGDILAMVKGLTKHRKIDRAAIGVMGHSQGGSIAPMAAIASTDIAFVILLAAMTIPGDQVMYTQKKMILQAAGLTGHALDLRMAAQRKMLDAVLRDAPSKEMQAVVSAQLEVDLGAQASFIPAAQRAQILKGAIAQVSAKSMVSLIKNNPAQYLEKLTVPVLAIFGEKDLQVEPKANEKALRRHLKTAGNTAYESWIVPSMSHNFQTTKTGKVEELVTIDQTVRPDVMVKIAGWIKGIITK